VILQEGEGYLRAENRESVGQKIRRFERTGNSGVDDKFKQKG
jgi:hypothetical protein